MLNLSKEQEEYALTPPPPPMDGVVSIPGSPGTGSVGGAPLIHSTSKFLEFINWCIQATLTHGFPS
jgi:hypothetical protein